MKKNNTILIWSSCKRVKEYIIILEIWGYTYINTLLVWVKLNKSNEKPKIGLGFWSRNNVELLLMGRRGTFAHFKNKNRNTS